jgi:acyl carrier protein
MLKITEAKVAGIHTLSWLGHEYSFDFVVLFSSTAYVLGGIGLSSYAAANAVAETAAVLENTPLVRTKWLSVGWDAWLTERYAAENGLPPALREFAVEPATALNALFHLLECGMSGPFIISSGNLSARYSKSLEPPSAPLGRELPAGSRPSQSYIPPVNDLENTIAEVWQRHLGGSLIGRDDKFFELGGNSLLALRIVSDLRKRLGIEVPVIAVFEGVTVSGMATVLSTQDRDVEILDDSRKRGAERRRRSAAESDEGVLVNN